MLAEGLVNDRIGRVEMTPKDAVVVGEYHSRTVVYTVGRYGMDMTGGILVLVRMISDLGEPQSLDPNASNYVSAICSDPAVGLLVHWDKNAYIRPFRYGVRVTVRDRPLAAGETITVVFGDRSAGSPGWRAQTYADAECDLRVMADCFASNHYEPLPERLCFPVIAGRATQLEVILPSSCGKSEEVDLVVRAEDKFGNPADGFASDVSLACRGLAALPASVSFRPGDLAAKRITGLRVTEIGMLRATATADGLRAISNPMEVSAAAPPLRLYWGDLQAQTRETVGAGTPDRFFAFARDFARIDFVAHSANDFQVTDALFSELRDLVRSYDEPGRFVPFLSYEWSGNTPNGGDFNIIFKGHDATLLRSSYWLLPGEHDPELEKPTIAALFHSLRGRDDVIAVGHVGGRRANLDYFDPEFVPLIEICSAHGWFEWWAREAIARGLKVGFGGGSDDHSCRPGAVKPFGHFGSRGGLLGVWAENCSREAIWQGLKARRTVATTGDRIVMMLCGDGHAMGQSYATRDAPNLSARVVASVPIERIDLLRGDTTIHSWREAAPALRNRIRISWSGARTKGRWRNSDWSGGLTIKGGTIRHAEAWAFDSVFEGLSKVTETEVAWTSSTAGDADGVILDLNADDSATIELRTPVVNADLSLGEIRNGGVVIEAGLVEQRVVAETMPIPPSAMEATLTYRDTIAPPGESAYFLRLVLANGEMAWSTPVWVMRA